MLITIVLPVYNVARYIERSLCSALDQTYPSLEIILINDGSTDESMHIVTSILDSHPRKDAVKIITHEKNQGPSGGRNTGLRHATGEYVFFLDNDDCLLPDAIENLAKPAAEFHPDCVVGDYRVSDSAYRKLPLLLENGLYSDSDAIHSAYFRRKIYIMVWNKLYRRQFLLEHKLFFKDNLIHEDELWSFQLFSVIKSLYVLQKETYLYEIRQDSIMGKISRNTIDYRLTITREMVDWVKGHPQLKRDADLFYFFEDWKNKLFRSVSKYPELNLFSHYQQLRNLHFLKGTTFTFQAGRFKERIRTIHYFLPEQVGYKLQKKLLK